MESTEDSVTRELLDPKKIKLFRDEKGNLRLTIEEDRSFLKVKVVRGFPLSRIDEYIGFLDGADEEIGTIKSLEDLDPESRKLSSEDLDARYFVPQIKSIISLKDEFGTAYWAVQTDKGIRDFVVRNFRENVIHVSPLHLLLTDIDGNRFELKDYSKLDKKSLTLLERIL